MLVTALPAPCGGGVEAPFDSSCTADTDTPAVDVATATPIAVTPNNVTPTDITGDFLCPKFLAAVREVSRVPDGKIYASDVAGITCLDISHRRITKIAGIKHFSALRWLNIQGNQIQTIDLSNNLLLEELHAFATHTTVLNISQNTLLRVLSVAGNRLAGIDLSNNPALAEIFIGNSRRLTGVLDLSNNPLVQRVFAHNTNLKGINLPNNPALTTLNIRAGQISELNLSNSPLLRELHAQENLLKSLDLSNNPLLTHLDVRWNCIGEPENIIGLPYGVGAPFTANHSPDGMLGPGFRFWPQESGESLSECPNFLETLREFFERPYPLRIYLRDFRLQPS